MLSKVRFSDTVIIVALFFVVLVDMTNTLALSPFLPDIARSLRSSVPFLGQAIALTQILSAAIALVIGPIGDLYGNRRVLCVGTIAIIGSSTLIGIAPSAAFLFGAATIASLARSSVAPVSLSIAGTSFTGDSRKHAVSWIQSAISGATVVSIPILATVAAYFGWRAAFYTIALLACVMLAVVVWLVPRDPVKQRSPFRLRDVLSQYQLAFRQRSLIIVIVQSMFRSAAVWIVGTYLGTYLVEVFKFGNQAIGFVYMTYGIASLLGNYLTTRPEIKHFDIKTLLVLSNAMHAIALATVFVIQTHWLVSVVAVAAVGVAGTIAGFATSMRLLDEGNVESRSTMMTANQSAYAAGTAVGAALGGGIMTFGTFANVGEMSLVLGLVATVLALYRPGSPRAVVN